MGIAALRSPLYEGVFDSTVVNDLTTLYSALYPDRVIHRVLPFYEYSGHATLLLNSSTEYVAMSVYRIVHFNSTNTCFLW